MTLIETLIGFDQARCNVNKVRRLFKTLKLGIVKEGEVFRDIKI
jgi:hypothetical protein